MVVGTVGNVISAYTVVKSKNLWKNTISLYILVLAIVDTLILDTFVTDKLVWNQRQHFISYKPLDANVPCKERP